ncbi:(deoxy)nucleoside triphosphate pyrophosphohydrolase [Desulfonatronum thioautotrophicum]|uniref:(deoxy)nucleoside triphosphate pyrophosphohydrolase n=1 Tax=Desulfonatronum thioautotrophicum TaxID=617001 RepID=UPI0005EB9C04|nr:(deoxy)nucleoside triphosphate pyrophosphohydrolase [Desulfonatronum thioautotrophicum]
MKTGSPLNVVAAVIWRDGRYLAVQRPAGKLMAGYWEFPGGKVEQGESLEQALVRELSEELAITAVDFFLWRQVAHAYPDLEVLLHVFWVTSFHGKPLPLENQSMLWVEPGGELPPFLQADLEIVAELATVSLSRI